MPSDLVATWSTWELLAFPYLDTDLPDFAEAAKLELESRSISPTRLALLRAATAGGLWWNVLWWEWVSLDGTDVAHGWLLNLSLVIALVVGLFWGLLAAIVALMGLSIASSLVLRPISSRHHRN